MKPMADPGFSVFGEGGANPLGRHWPLTRVLFGKKVKQHESRRAYGTAVSGVVISVN